MIELNNTVECGNITISNLLGQIVSTNKLINQKNIKIGISNISSGLYLINLKTNKANITQKILIK